MRCSISANLPSTFCSRVLWFPSSAAIITSNRKENPEETLTKSAGSEKNPWNSFTQKQIQNQR
jgi:hypothetical protein